MAATGTPTPNIGLRIPLGTDPASVDDINYNSNLIDAKLGAVGNDSVQDQIDDLNSNLGNHVIRSFTKTGIAIADGSTQSPSFITIDCSDYVPTGKVIYNAIVSVQSGTKWYVLPNMENDGVRYTVLERVGNTTVVIKNTEAGWGTTNVTITLFIK